MNHAPATYEVIANNLSRESENKIHDDEVARRFGFTGGLVPGVEVYAYACHLIVRRWGRDWLGRGTAECRFLKPVYDGRRAVVTATETANGLDWRVESDGVLCATGQAALGPAGSAPPDVAEFPSRPVASSRPPADERSLAPDSWFTSKPLRLTRETVSEYLEGVSEADPLYAEQGLAHPGQVLRLCNYVLAQNVTLGPWIHVGSKVQNFSAAKVGEEIAARARVLANYERKGHRFVDLDVLILAGEARPISRVFHTAVYQPRQVSEAA